MKERPILFSGPDVRAILDRRKTQTRRVVEFNGFHQHGRSGGQVGYSWIEHKPTARGVTCDMQDLLTLCPYGQPGDRLWVRETWCGGQHGTAVQYRADWEESEYGPAWRRSTNMPRWASRITLEVVSVRVERVQDITEADARAEGAPDSGQCNRPHFNPGEAHRHRLGFANIWDAINAKRGAGWDANPWVWVIEFKRVEVKV